VEQRETTRATVGFVKDMLAMKGNSYTETFCSRSKDNCATVDGYPGSFSHSELTFQKITEELPSVPEREINGSIRRLGDLGYFIFNDLLWTRDWKTFPIGADLEDHRKHRPTADLLMGWNSAAWNKDMISDSAQAFFRGRTSIKQEDYNLWVSRLLHKILLDIELSDADAEEFESYKGKAIAACVLPRWVASGVSWALGIKTLQDTRDKLIAKYERAMEADKRGIIPPLEGRDRRFLADLLLTTMTSAGGLSVPSVIQLCLGILYGGDNSPLPVESRKLTKDTILPFVFETIRRYPVVVGFPWWSADQSQRTVMNLAMGLRDPRAWDFPEEFKLRPLSEYHGKVGSGTKIGLAWAEQAKGPGDVTADSRGCPGQELSIVIITEFLKALLPTQSVWSVTDMPSGGIQITEGPSVASDFTLTLESDYVDVSAEFAGKESIEVRGPDGLARAAKCCCPDRSQRCILAFPSGRSKTLGVFDWDGCGHLVGHGWHKHTTKSGKCWIKKEDADKYFKMAAHRG
jgi:hypothetical protein